MQRGAVPVEVNRARKGVESLPDFRGHAHVGVENQYAPDERLPANDPLKLLRDTARQFS